MPGVAPRPGDVLVVGKSANRRYAGENQILLRVIKVLPTQARVGWMLLYGYEVDDKGHAKKRCAVWALREGLKPIQITVPRPAPRMVRR
jgi:hypothetical protein